MYITCTWKKLPKQCSYEKFVRKNVDEIDTEPPQILLLTLVCHGQNLLHPQKQVRYGFQGSISPTGIRAIFMQVDPKSTNMTDTLTEFLSFWNLRA
jgi:hypothetical protein